VGKWLLLVYRLPSEPSAPRVALWRALKRLDGGAYVADGVFAIRDSEIARQDLDNLAHDVRNDGGEATVLAATPLDDDRYLAAMMKSDATAPPDKRKPRAKAR
jgi:hypothetical protein